MNRSVLIIGGAGFIGTNAARLFLKSGWKVSVFDNFSRKGAEENVAAVRAEFADLQVVRGDICQDLKRLADLVETHAHVLHLAGQVAVTTSVTDPRTDLEKNVVGTFNVLEAIRVSKNPPAIIYSSTNKVYGALEDKPVREAETRYEFADGQFRAFGVPETQNLDFHSPYGCSKGAADQYVIDYSRIYGLRTLVFRQSCIYGPFQYGIEDQGWLAWFTIAAMSGRPITLYGTGKQVRDVLFVEDLVSLYRLAFENINRVSGRAYNVGGGPKNTLSLVELLEHLRTAFGYAPAISYADARPGDQPVFVADVRKLERELGWQPTTTPAQGIERMHSWLVERGGLAIQLARR